LADILPSSVAPIGVTVMFDTVFRLRSSRLPTAGTPVGRPTTTIVRMGPYRLTTIYLAFSLLQLSLSLWVNSLALLITLIPAVALMWLVIIPREERYLEAKFPSEYLRYKTSARRWL
jgi:protein-S-isoprenylcysteine O-methyltransferase Ste14